MKKYKVDDLDDMEDIKHSKSKVKKKKASAKKNIVVRKHISRKGMMYTFFTIVAVLFISLTLYLLSPKIYLDGKKTVVIDYGGNYKEEGATGKFWGKNVTSDIKKSGSVDTSKVGVYEIKYNIKKMFFNVTVTRIVKVVDTKKPVIELTGNIEVNICPKGSYQEEGYKAYDEYDGDLTDKVKITTGDDKITYKVLDSSNNSYEVSRKLNKIDNDKPEITLSGGSNYYVKLGSTYKDPGYKAIDNCDGDLTDKVEVSGKVDSSKEGKYSITYTVNDSNKNKTTVTRVVNVSKKTDINSGESRSGVIYLTFDDGPSSATTETILDILKEENVKATFFVTNSGPDSLIKREFNEGHTVALHTASHNYGKIYSSVDNYFSDLEIVLNRVLKLTGQKTNIIRFPGGSSNTISRHYDGGTKIMTTLTNEVLNRGYRYYDWNVDANDAGTCSKSSVTDKKACVYKNVVNNLSKSRANIVLMHDIKYHTRDALRDIIKYGKANGYTFSAIDENVKMVRFNVNN